MLPLFSTRPAAWFGVALLSVSACRQAPAGGEDGRGIPGRLSLVESALPAPPGSSHVQVASSSRGVLASWIERQGETTALRYSERRAQRWTTPVTAASGRNWFVNWADVPGVMRLKNGALVAHWYTNTDVRAEGYDLQLSVSHDDGTTWSAPMTPHHDATRTQHGFASLFDLDGGLGLVWLDAREWALATDDPEGGAVMLRFAAFDAGWRQVADEPVNLRVCECCQTAAVTTPAGVLTAFRDRGADSVRDIVVSRLERGRWTTETLVHPDGWQLEACPVNGPALANDGRWTAAAWFTGVGDEGHAYLAYSSDHGHSWQPPVRLDDEQSLGRVDVELLPGSGAVVTWIEYSGERSRARVRWLDPSGARSSPIDLVAEPRRVIGTPRIGRAGGEIVVAWAEAVDAAGDPATVQAKAATVRLDPAP